MCCCLPPCFWWLCFTPRALRTIGDPRSPEEIERQRKRREERARRRRWWRCQRAPPDGERNGETATGQVASRGGEIELGEFTVLCRDLAELCRLCPGPSRRAARPVVTAVALASPRRP